MEGRVPPAPDGDDTDDNSLPLHSSGSKSLPPAPSPLLITPPSDMYSETYVIQIPKDQIYRIPPPENALFVERHGKKPVEKKNKARPKCWVWIIGSILAVLALIIALILVTLSIVYRSKSPSFSVAHVLVKYAQNSTHKHSQSAGYTISLKANNPNEIMGIDYDSGGVVTLSSEGKKIATGEFPSLEQGENGFKKIKVFLKGTKETLPKEIEKSQYIGGGFDDLIGRMSELIQVLDKVAMVVMLEWLGDPGLMGKCGKSRNLALKGIEEELDDPEDEDESEDEDEDEDDDKDEDLTFIANEIIKLFQYKKKDKDKPLRKSKFSRKGKNEKSLI
ncbi:hypothetical protein SO802_025199 [Lithocarpus litseifolius]|uniref:Late embryogenesis abundant protein LEA-2 subgroup domain-containing protein n=1 Tax=Lithocarpus litseifolius TaxID=425828 RepID=A0AAW2BZL5_9ROSI